MVEIQSDVSAGWWFQSLNMCQMWFDFPVIRGKNPWTSSGAYWGSPLLGGLNPTAMRSVASTTMIETIETVASCISVVSQLGRFLFATGNSCVQRRWCIDPVHSAGNLGAADQ